MSQKEPLKCLKYVADECKPGESCEPEEVECETMHCYAITQRHNGKHVKLLSGCWNGGEECSPPVSLVHKINKTIVNQQSYHDKWFIDKLENYKISEQLLDPAIQESCITYVSSPNESHYLSRNNKSFCCCSTPLCNQNLVYMNEPNPFEAYAIKMNPIFKAKPTEKVNTSSWLISSRDLSMMCLSGLVCLVFISVVFSLVLLLKKTSKKKNDRYFSSIFYSRANSLNVEMVTSNLDTNPFVQVQQPLLDHANNANVVRSYQEQINLGATDNLLKISTHTEVGMYEQSLLLDEKQIDMHTELLPCRIKASHISLADKIAHGQFSSVWKGRCKSATETGCVLLDEPEYAVKIFASMQKTAWSNEKEIYNSMTANENILRFFGSDTYEPPSGGGRSCEYWLITEYHPVGSLYDFLNQNLLDWVQIVSLINSFLEGLAYLHGETTPKGFAIAHRDLKSKNILVKNDLRSCCIGDFGLALKLENKNKLASAEIRSKVGTKRYMSPELIEGAIAFTKETFLRIDLYASALVLWEIISRGNFYGETYEYKLPFQDEVGKNPSLEEMKEVVVDKCMRPVIQESWLKNYQLTTIAQTIEECWDIDLDARISAECALARIKKIYKTI